jgi:hypothetical protein
LVQLAPPAGARRLSGGLVRGQPRRRSTCSRASRAEATNGLAEVTLASGSRIYSTDEAEGEVTAIVYPGRSRSRSHRCPTRPSTTSGRRSRRSSRSRTASAWGSVPIVAEVTENLGRPFATGRGPTRHGLVQGGRHTVDT